MRATLNNIEDAVDRKYLIMKNIKGQAESGTLVHIMGAANGPDGVSVKYRVTSTGQDYVAKFTDVKQFSKWAVADNFLARYQDNLTKKDIRQYLKMRDASVVTACAPVLFAALLIVWAVIVGGIFLSDMKTWQLLVGGVCLSVMVFFLVSMYHRHRKDRIMTNIYNKVATNWQGGGVVIR